MYGNNTKQAFYQSDNVSKRQIFHFKIIKLVVLIFFNKSHSFYQFFKLPLLLLLSLLLKSFKLY